MPWWSWLIIAAVIAAAVPLKLKIFKSIMEKNKRNNIDEEE
jgi:hypothetical protein